jgi:hypothetical protein
MRRSGRNAAPAAAQPQATSPDGSKRQRGKSTAARPKPGHRASAAGSKRGAGGEQDADRRATRSRSNGVSATVDAPTRAAAASGEPPLPLPSYHTGIGRAVARGLLRIAGADRGRGSGGAAARPKRSRGSSSSPPEQPSTPKSGADPLSDDEFDEQEVVCVYMHCGVASVA